MGFLSMRMLHICVMAVFAIRDCYGRYRFTELAQNHTVIASKDSVVTLRCRFAEAHNLKKIWGNGSNVLFLKEEKISGNNRVTLLRNDNREFSIRIERVNMYDEGEYTCTIYDADTESSISQTVYLTVNVPAYLTTVSKKIKTVNEGERFFLKCLAEGKPRPVIRWRHLVPSGDGVMGTGTHLPIINITKDGEGIYECSADNNMGSPEIHTMQIYVRYPPEMNRRRVKKDVKSDIGKSIVLECTASSYPLPTFVWKHGDIVYKDRSPSSRVQVATARYRKYTVRSKLNIDSIEEDDFGKYECIAENEKGKANMTIFLSRIVLIKRIPPSEAFSVQTTKQRKKGGNSAFGIHGPPVLMFIAAFLQLKLLESR